MEWVNNGIVMFLNGQVIIRGGVLYSKIAVFHPFQLILPLYGKELARNVKNEVKWFFHELCGKTKPDTNKIEANHFLVILSLLQLGTSSLSYMAA